MAKPEHTAYQILADFGEIESPVTFKGEGGTVETLVGPAGLNTDCIQFRQAQPALKAAPSFADITGTAMRIGGHPIVLTFPSEGFLCFGYAKANTLLEQCRKQAKTQYKKGERPTFFMRKMTMSDFMSHKGFKQYKDHSTVKSLYKKYLLLNQIHATG